jgi:pseudaminic acid synthase
MTEQSEIIIAGRPIGPSRPPYVVAEMSGNHNGDINRALRILDVAKAAGVDAVKIQTYRPDTITIDHDAPEFTVVGGLWDGRRLYDLYEEAHTPWDWHGPIFEYAARIGLTVFSSPFDPTAVDLLEDLAAPAFKIASPELIDLPLIRRVAATGKPMVLSTGMASVDEIGEAVSAARDAGANQIVVLHCTAAYPAPAEEANLASIPDIRDRYSVVPGLSDHTMGTTVAVAAVALGACFIEKHVTLSRAAGGIDSAFSLEPEELAILVRDTRIAHAAIGNPQYTPTDSEKTVLKNRRSLYVVAPVAKGEAFSEHNIRSIRPGKGLLPKYFDAILGRKATRDIAYGEALAPEMIDGWTNRT